MARSRTITIRNSNEVASIKIVKLRNYKNRQLKKWLKEKSAINWVNLVRSSRMLKKEVKKVRNSKIKQNMNKGSKEFWTEVNKMRGLKSSKISSMVVNGNESQDENQIAEGFIDFFINKVDGLIGDYSPSSVPLGDINIVDEDLFRDREIIEAFTKLSNKKSTGMDSISGYFIKIFVKELTPYLTFLFNTILRSGLIPGLWKIAKITPVHKKGDSKSLGNFQPVSNLLSIAKLFELCVLKRLMSIDHDYLFGSFQHGFRQSHSTVTAVAELVNSITDQRESGKVVAVYSADLTAAFDVLRKEILVEKLIQMGLPRFMIRIIQEYLSDRMGFVQVGEGVSCVRDIRTGCIQGSILGPILFNIYTNELETIIAPHKAICYADDSYVVVAHEKVDELKVDLKKVITEHTEWLTSIGMVFNSSKTELITFGSQNLTVEIDNVEIKSKRCVKILGMLMDDKLSWEDHIYSVICKCKSHIFALRYIRTFLNVDDTSRVFRAHLVSILTYGSPFWSHALSYNLRAKNRSVYYLALRIILRDFDLNLNRNQLLKKTHSENLDTIFFLRTSIFIFKVIKTLSPTTLAGEFICRSYLNERRPGILTFFDSSRSRISKKNISNALKNYSDNWNFMQLAGIINLHYQNPTQTAIPTMKSVYIIDCNLLTKKDVFP